MHTLEQRVAQQLLQPRQLTAHRGLRCEEQPCSARHPASEHDGAKHLDVAMLDARQIRRGACHIGERVNP